MIKRLLLYLVAASVLLAVAISANQWDEDSALLQEHALQISEHIEKQIGDAQNWLNANPLSILKNAGTNQKAQTAIAEQAQKDYTLLHLRGKEIDFWSNTKAVIDPKFLSANPENKTLRLLHTPHGDYATYAVENHDAWHLVMPICYKNDAAARFVAGKNIPDQIKISAEKSDYPIVAKGQPIGFVHADAPLYATWLSWFKLVFLGLFVVVLLALFTQVAHGLSERYAPVAGASAVALAASGIVFINKKMGLTAGLLGALPAFATPFSKPSLLGNTLGDWLIGVGLFSWAGLFFFQHFRFRGLADKSQGSRMFTAVAAFAGIMATAMSGAALLSHLVLYSKIDFDFDNLLNLQALALLAMGGLLVWWLGAFLVAHRLARIVYGCALAQNQRLAAIGLAAVAALSLAFVLKTPINPLYISGFALLYAVAFDFFAHDEKAGTGWVVAWLLILSLYSGLLLYGFNDQENRSRRMAYAAALTHERDGEVAEQSVLALQAQWIRDSAVLGQMLKPFPFKAAVEEVQTWFNQRYYASAYLFQNYRLNALAFDPTGQPLLKDQKLTHAQAVLSDWANGKPLSDQVRYGLDAEGKFRYMLRLPVLRMGDATQPADVYCFLEQEFAKSTRVYAQLFYQKPYKGLEGLNRYDFAIEKNGRLVAERGQNGLLALAQEAENGKTIDLERPSLGRLDAVSRSADGKSSAVVGRSGGDWYKPLYLFSVLFALAATFFILVGLFNRWLRFLPLQYELVFSTKGSLAKRIHSSNIVLILAAFLLVSIMAYLQFDKNALENEQLNVDSRSEAMLAMLHSEAIGSGLGTDSLRRSLPVRLNALAGSFGMDANLYNTEGDLLFSTQPDLQQAGVLSSKMSMNALNTLKNKLVPSLSTQEYVGGAAFSCKYFTLRDSENKPLGFLGVPYNLSSSQMHGAASDFLGLLASLFVFLLLTAFAVSYLLSHSITKPLSLISEKIRQLRYDNKNEPLAYAGDAQDEVSALIMQYNEMVEKLEDSKQKMVKLERESAWREMARQVAHDIKNPLTTMKLSMQQLDRLSGNPEQAAAYLRKAITRLIEQIDSLAQIASEFSMFANLDIREKPPMELNNVVESVYDLFSEQQNVSLDLDMPDENFIINGDKNHLIRVFNNLVINAIQAVPSDRKGHIKVALRRKDNKAQVQVSDNAGGIPPEIRDRVFEPNFTTKTSGSGLGLAICRKIVESHDGQIFFETRDNEGTDFFVELPIAQVGKLQASTVEMA